MTGRTMVAKATASREAGVARRADRALRRGLAAAANVTAANTAAERFQFANDASTAYVRVTLFTALTLFLGALAGRFAYRPLRYGMLGLAGLMLLIGIVNALALPKI